MGSSTTSSPRKGKETEMLRTIVMTCVALVAVGLVTSQAYGRTAGAETQVLHGPYLGSYAANLTIDQAIARGDSRMAGRFTLNLRRNGTYTNSNPLDGKSGGRLADLGHHRLRFYDDRGCKIGRMERPQGGIYRWSVSAKRLTLRLINEGACTGRTQSLTYPVWIRR
jgi:hypothetical protein